jgi:hypothetical protein
MVQAKKSPFRPNHQGEEVTINVAVSTFDAIVLGCDSFSSLTDTAIFPFRHGGPGLAMDGEGKLITDADGNYMVSISTDHLESVAATVYSGVSKMFLLYEDADTSVAATTAGLGTLNGLTIAAHAGRYRRECKKVGRTFGTVKEVADDFRAYIRHEWEKQIGWNDLPEEAKAFQGTVQFIVAGFCREVDTGQLFIIDILANTCDARFEEGGTGVCWTGQSNYVERLLQGIDSRLKTTVGRQTVRALEEQRGSILASISEAMAAAGVHVPEGLELTVAETVEPSLPWSAGWADIDYANLPPQYAIDFASFMVNTQSGMQHFSNGIATVGGRTHIGILRRGEPFKMLHEPDLVHDHIGFSHEK